MTKPVLLETAELDLNDWRSRAPLTPEDCDLRDLDGFMLNVERLLASELWALATPAEFKAALALWCRAWKQLPAASLPDDDDTLRNFSAAGRRWAEVRKMALRGFVKCSDGRLYHKTLAEDANRAHAKKRERKVQTAAATEARMKKRRRTQPSIQSPSSDGRFCTLPSPHSGPQPAIAKAENTNAINEAGQRNVDVASNVTTNVTTNVTKSQGQRQGHNPHNPLVATLPEKPPNGSAPHDPFDAFLAAYQPPRSRPLSNARLAFERSTHPPNLIVEAAKRYAAEVKDPEFRVAPEKFLKELLGLYLTDAAKELQFRRDSALREDDLKTAWGSHAEALFSKVTKPIAVAFFGGTTLEITPTLGGSRVHFANQSRASVCKDRFQTALETFLPKPVRLLGPENAT